MKTTDLRAKQLADDAQRLADIDRARLARHARFTSDSTWIAPRRVTAPDIEAPSEAPALPDHYVADFLSRYFGKYPS